MMIFLGCKVLKNLVIFHPVTNNILGIDSQSINQFKFLHNRQKLSIDKQV